MKTKPFYLLILLLTCGLMLTLEGCSKVSESDLSSKLYSEISGDWYYVHYASGGKVDASGNVVFSTTFSSTGTLNWNVNSGNLPAFNSQFYDSSKASRNLVSLSLSNNLGQLQGYSPAAIAGPFKVISDNKFTIGDFVFNVIEKTSTSLIFYYLDREGKIMFFVFTR
jgi:hypothetical protein